MTNAETESTTFWALISRAEDIPGVWVAHVLDIDVVTQGSSLRAALEMAIDATTTVVSDDREAGRMPTSRRAPEEYWEALRRLFREGSFVPNAQDILDHQDAFSEVAIQIHLPDAREPAGVSSEHRSAEATALPPVWMRSDRDHRILP